MRGVSCSSFEPHVLTFTVINLLDILIRMMVLGQLLLLCVLLLRQPVTVIRQLLLV